MIFKTPELQDELAHTPALLQVMAEWFCQLSIAHFEIDPVATRVMEKVHGSSGVHELGRAIDFRSEFSGVFIYSPEQIRFLVSEMNRRFPRTDGKSTCMHHSFGNGPFHFHIQLGLGQVTKDIGEDINLEQPEVETEV